MNRRTVNAAALAGALAASTVATASAGLAVGAVASYQADRVAQQVEASEQALTVGGGCPVGWRPIYYQAGRWYCAAPWLRSAYGVYFAQESRRG